MGGYCKSVITRDIPYMYESSADELSSSDIFRLERVHNVSPKDFVLVKNGRECIILNKENDNLERIKELIEKVMRSRYIQDKLFNEFESLTDRKSADILLWYYSEWRNEVETMELHKQALQMIKSAKGLRISWKVKRNRKIIKELFDIGFGVYEVESVCDWQKGAENVFMYGYLLGIQSQKEGAACG